MKKIYYILFSLLLSLGLFTSCNDWLDVQPYDKFTPDQMYQDERGVQTALNGLYLDLLQDKLYGANLSFIIPEVLAQHWVIRSGHEYENLVNFKYEEDNVKKLREDTWKAAYKYIADCNDFMEQITLNKNNYSEKFYKLCYGEALALRTYLHLDMLRLYGPIYNESGKKEEAIPYYETLTSVPNPIITSEEVVKKMLNDIDKAIELLVDDPIKNGITKGEGFWDYRQVRMNYFAAWALKARICTHAKLDYHAEAYKIASSLLNGKDPKTEADNNFLGIIVPLSSSTTNEYVFFSEMLFGMHNIRRDEIYKKYFTTDLLDASILMGGWAFLMEQSSLYSASDPRLGMWEVISAAERQNQRLFKKYAPITINTSLDPNPYRGQIMTLIRLGELFLTATETAETDDLKIFWLEKFRLSRGEQENNMVGKVIQTEQDKEYIKEFYGEGQRFYYLKRNEVQSVRNWQWTNITAIKDNYKFPIPDSEINNRY